MPTYRTREGAFAAREDGHNAQAMLHSILKDDKHDGLSDAEYSRRLDAIPTQSEGLVEVLRESDAAPNKTQAAEKRPQSKRKSGF